MHAALLAGLLLWQAPQAQEPSPEVLLQRIRKAYSGVRTAQVRTRLIVRSASGLRADTVTNLSFAAPNRIHAKVASSARGVKPFTYISDGERLQTMGRPGQNGVKPFDLQTIQTDGPPVFKETLSFWDWRRQWDTQEGGRFEDNEYTVRTERWVNRDWLVLREDHPLADRAHKYYVDPKTHLIKRTLAEFKHVKGSVEYVVESITLNKPIGPELFVIHEGRGKGGRGAILDR